MLSALLFVLQPVNGGWVFAAVLLLLILLYLALSGVFSSRLSGRERLWILGSLAAALLVSDCIVLFNLFPDFAYKNLGMAGAWLSILTPTVCVMLTLAAIKLVRKAKKNREEE